MHSSIHKSGTLQRLESRTQLIARTSTLLGASMKTIQTVRPSAENFITKPDLRTSESLTQLKLTAEKMIQEQASVQEDLQNTLAKLERSEKEVRILEMKLQETKNENAMLRVKHQESLKLWEGLEFKFSSSKTYSDQIMETLQQLAHEVKEAEEAKYTLQEKLTERLRFYEESKIKLDDLNSKKQNAERISAEWERKYLDMKDHYERVAHSFSQESEKVTQLLAYKEEAQACLKASERSLNEERERTVSAQRTVEKLQNQHDEKVAELKELNENQEHLIKLKTEFELQAETMKVKLANQTEENGELKENIERLMQKVKDLEDSNAQANENLQKVLSDLGNCKECAQEEKRCKEELGTKLKDIELQNQELIVTRAALESQIQDLKQKLKVVYEDHEIDRKQSFDTIQELTKELDANRHNLHELSREKIKLGSTCECLEEKVATLSKTITECAREKDDLIAEKSMLKALSDKVREDTKNAIEEKEREAVSLRAKIADNQLLLHQLENEKSDLLKMCSDKDIQIKQLLEEQGCLNSKYLEALAQKDSVEQLVQEIRRQAEIQLEAKQMELNKHIKEISERNDQEIREMRTKYENDTKEAMNKEEQKAKSMLETLKEECNLQISKIQEAALSSQKDSEEKHAAEIRELLANHKTEKSELQVQCQSETKKKQELLKEIEREKTKWSEEMELRLRELQAKHTDEMKKLRTDKAYSCSKADSRVSKLEHQITVLQEKVKEEKLKREENLKASEEKFEDSVRTFEGERKLLEENHQKTIRGMQDSFQKELEELKLKCLMWETKCNNMETITPKTQENMNKLSYEAFYSTPKVAELSKSDQAQSADEKAKCDSVSLPTHSKTVTHDEYEVATSDGKKTIRRKRTKSTVMFESQSALSIKKIGSRKSTRLSSQQKKIKPLRINTNSMIDLFGGKSLDPYADDPYAFT